MDLSWIKAAASNPSGNCVELASLGSQGVALRNSRFPDGALMVFTSGEIAAFLAGAKAGEFDHLVS